MELWDLYNAQGEYQHKTILRGEKIPEGYYHRIVHIWIYNENQELLIQKRANHLTWFPDKWATTTGSVISGEFDLKNAAIREVEEELGLDSSLLDLDYVVDFIIGDSIVSYFDGFLPKPYIKKIKLNEEVSAIQWIKASRIEELRKTNQFAEYNQQTFDLVYHRLDHLKNQW